jgi:antirestriction protein
VPIQSNNTRRKMMLEVYLTDLGAYNKGFLIGEWISLPIDEQELESTIKKILRSGEALCALEYGYESHEEYFITDWEWKDLNFFDIDEYDNVMSLNETTSVLESLSPYQQKAVMYLMREGIADDIADAVGKIDDVIVYKGMSMIDVAMEYLESCCDLKCLPSIITNYIDYEVLARDLELEGRYTILDGDIYEYMN